jgi:hydrogenase-4 component F
MSWALYAIVAVPLLATLVSLLGPGLPARIATATGGVGALTLAVILALDVEHGRVLHALSGWLRLDALGAVFLLATGFLYATAAIYSIGYLRAGGDAGFSRRYHGYLNMFGWTMLLVPLAADFGSLWIAVELTTIISALLVALERTDAALEASWKYVLIASTGLGIALLAVILLYAAGTGALGSSYVPRFDRLLAHSAALPQEPVKLAFLLAALGFGTKVGFVPVHTWLPDAHSEAPSPVSAMLSGSLLAAAFYAILRFFQVTVATGNGTFARHVLLVFGAASLVGAGFFVLRQASYKRLLAYSSIEHMGVVALGVGFGAPLAIAGALLHVITHASAKALAFFGAGSILRRYDSKEVDHIVGAGTVLPFTGPLFLAAALALSGLPLSGVFRSEFQIVAGGFASPAYFWVTLLIVFVNLAFFGIIWHAGRMVLSTPTADTEPLARGETSWWMVGAMGMCLVVVVALGVHLPGDLSTLLSTARERLTTPV